MKEHRVSNERGQSLVLVASAMVALVIFVAITVDVSSAYYNRRTAQNAADGAALAGVSRMATGINKKNSRLDDDIKADMNDFAERNGIEDTTANLADDLNDNVDGWYVDMAGNRLAGEPMVGEQYLDRIPDGAAGIEAIAYITAPTYFGGMFGFDGYPLQARAVALLREACGSDCVVPIVTQKDALFDGDGEPLTEQCFNIYSESETGAPGSYGWVSWTWQEGVCGDGSRPCPLVPQGNGCDTTNLEGNLHPDNCASGYIRVDDWVANTPGIANASTKVLCYLNYYLGYEDPNLTCDVEIGDPQPFTIVVYDYTNVSADNPNPASCSGRLSEEELADLDPDDWGLHYHVAGFAKMQILGYRLSQGGDNISAGIEGTPEDGDCLTFGDDPHQGNRITAQLIDYVTDIDSSSECFDPTGTLRSSPKLVE